MMQWCWRQWKVKKVKLVEGSYYNIKITTPEDLDIAEIFVKKCNLQEN